MNKKKKHTVNHFYLYFVKTSLEFGLEAFGQVVTQPGGVKDSLLGDCVGDDVMLGSQVILQGRWSKETRGHPGSHVGSSLGSVVR